MRYGRDLARAVRGHVAAGARRVLVVGLGTGVPAVAAGVRFLDDARRRKTEKVSRVGGDAAEVSSVIPRRAPSVL